MQIHAACAGDTLSGSVRGKAGVVEVKLFAKRGPSAAFAATGLTSSIRASGGNGSPFSFNVGRLTAAAYRVEAGDARSNEVPVASCAPGHQVPEAPLTLLLPLSVLALVTLTFGRRRFLGSRL
jgi:hypothetical protein